jgi:hypothetical protein
MAERLPSAWWRGHNQATIITLASARAVLTQVIDSAIRMPPHVIARNQQLSGFGSSNRHLEITNSM